MFETGNTINAINWIPPMTITWDTSLFHASYLPYAQGSFGIAMMNGIAFSQFDQEGTGFGIFNMLIEDSVTIDFLSEFLFPFPVYFDAGNTIGMKEHDMAKAPQLQVWPNPTQGGIHIVAPGSEAGDVFVSDLTGRRVLHLGSMPANGPLDVSALSPGTYVIKVLTFQNHIYHGTFEKIP